MSVEEIVSKYIDDYMKSSIKMVKRHIHNHTRFMDDMINQHSEKIAGLIRKQGDSILAIFVKNNQLTSKRIATLEARIWKLEHR